MFTFRLHITFVLLHIRRLSGFHSWQTRSWWRSPRAGQQSQAQVPCQLSLSLCNVESWPSYMFPIFCQLLTLQGPRPRRRQLGSNIQKMIHAPIRPVLSQVQRRAHSPGWFGTQVHVGSVLLSPGNRLLCYAKLAKRSVCLLKLRASSAF